VIKVFVKPLEVDVYVNESKVEEVYKKVSPFIPRRFCEEPLKPYGYPEDLVLCVTDAIWSIGVRYVSHVIPVLNRIRAYQSRQQVSLKTPDEFLAHFSARLNDDGEWLANNFFENRQRTSTARTAWLKSYAIQKTLEILRDFGISTPGDLLNEIQNKKLRSALESVPGDSIGVRTDYLFMLAGCDELAKYDRQISRFLGLEFNATMRLYAIALLTEVAKRLNDDYPCLTTRSVDHFIWQAMSRTEDGFEVANASPQPKSVGGGIGARIPPSQPPILGKESPDPWFVKRGEIESICHDCYLAGLTLFLSDCRPRVEKRTWDQYRADGKRFERAYREGGTKVKGSWQSLPRKLCLSRSDYQPFEDALVNGGLSGASAYKTPIDGAFNFAAPCDECPNP
jgi:hypothetical protein